MYADENEKSFVILTRDLTTGDIRRSGRHGILSRREWEDESRRSLGTLLNPRSANVGHDRSKRGVNTFDDFYVRARVQAEGRGTREGGEGGGGHIGGFNAT